MVCGTSCDPPSQRGTRRSEFPQPSRIERKVEGSEDIVQGRPARLVVGQIVEIVLLETKDQVYVPEGSPCACAAGRTRVLGTHFSTEETGLRKVAL